MSASAFTQSTKPKREMGSDELRTLRSRYSGKLNTLHELFPNWTQEDLLFVLQETEGDLDLAIGRITEGHAHKWGEVKSRKGKKDIPVAATTREPTHSPSTADSTTKPAPVRGNSGRERGGFSGRRGGRPFAPRRGNYIPSSERSTTKAGSTTDDLNTENDWPDVGTTTWDNPPTSAQADVKQQPTKNKPEGKLYSSHFSSTLRSKRDSSNNALIDASNAFPELPSTSQKSVETTVASSPFKTSWAQIVKPPPSAPTISKAPTETAQSLSPKAPENHISIPPEKDNPIAKSSNIRDIESVEITQVVEDKEIAVDEPETTTTTTETTTMIDATDHSYSLSSETPQEEKKIAETAISAETKIHLEEKAKSAENTAASDKLIMQFGSLNLSTLGTSSVQTSSNVQAERPTMAFYERPTETLPGSNSSQRSTEILGVNNNSDSTQFNSLGGSNSNYYSLSQMDSALPSYLQQSQPSSQISSQYGNLLQQAAAAAAQPSSILSQHPPTTHGGLSIGTGESLGTFLSHQQTVAPQQHHHLSTLPEYSMYGLEAQRAAALQGYYDATSLPKYQEHLVTLRSAQSQTQHQQQQQQYSGVPFYPYYYTAVPSSTTYQQSSIQQQTQQQQQQTQQQQQPQQTAPSQVAQAPQQSQQSQYSQQQQPQQPQQQPQQAQQQTQQPQQTQQQYLGKSNYGFSQTKPTSNYYHQQQQQQQSLAFGGSATAGGSGAGGGSSQYDLNYHLPMHSQQNHHHHHAQAQQPQQQQPQIVPSQLYHQLQHHSPSVQHYDFRTHGSPSNMLMQSSIPPLKYSSEYVPVTANGGSGTNATADRSSQSVAHRLNLAAQNQQTGMMYTSQQQQHYLPAHYLSGLQQSSALEANLSQGGYAAAMGYHHYQQQQQQHHQQQSQQRGNSSQQQTQQQTAPQQ